MNIQIIHDGVDITDEYIAERLEQIRRNKEFRDEAPTPEIRDKLNEIIRDLELDLEQE